MSASQEIATNMHVNFNYQVDPNGNLRPEQEFAITALVEYRLNNLDFAIVRLAGNPGQTFGTGVIATADPQQNNMICIIGHPAGVPKRIEAGPVSGLVNDQIQYNDIDTLGGNSGSAIWHSPAGTIVGVHTNGGCTTASPAGTGFNFGVRIGRLLQVSPVLKSLAIDNHLHDISYVQGAPGWEIHDLTALVGGPNAADSPFAYLTNFAGQGPTARVVYRGRG